MKRISIQNVKNLETKINYLALFIFPIITFYLFEFYTHNPFVTMRGDVHLLNIVFFELTALFLFFITRRIRVALIIQNVLFMILGLANYFVLEFRSLPIMPWDILSISTAASVAGNYNYVFYTSTIIVLIGFAILIILSCLLKTKLEKGGKKRIIGTLTTLFLIIGYAFAVRQEAIVKAFDLYVKLFVPTTMQYKDGNVVAFLYETQFMHVAKPSGYNKEEAIAKIESYETDDEKIDKKPNVIVIMDETFSDLRFLGDFTTNKEFMPYIDSLLAGAENTISGHVNVSVLGGNTPNSEFEFLTGNSMAFLPQGSVAYQQYIKSQIPSLVSYFENLGYRTIGMHPYNAGGWNRNTIYPILGFDEEYFINDFASPKYIRKYISDETCFNKIINFYENKKEGEPLFLFNVTMQNHSAFTQKYTNFTPTIQANGSKSFPLSNYLSLLKETDTAYKELISYFSEVDEDTIIVFYGDHQPNDTVANPLWQLLGVDYNNLTLEQERTRYITPFVIWANFDIEEQKDITTSLNYLGGKVLNAANLPLPGYFKFLEDVEEDYPVVSGIQVQDKDRNEYTVKEQLDNLNEYAKLQYYMLFDTQE